MWLPLAFFVFGAAIQSEAVEPPAEPIVDDLVCDYDARGVATPSETLRKYYEVPGQGAVTVVYFMSQQRPDFADGAEAAVGWFDVDWAEEITTDDAGRVTRACIRAIYTTITPKIKNRRLARCMSDFTDQIEAHEARHVEITAAVLDQLAALMIGRREVEAIRITGQIDNEIARINTAFHNTRDGQRPGVRQSLIERCNRL